MRTLLLALLVVWAWFAALIGGALLVGRGQPESPLIERLHLSDCALPCWIGILPGETPTGRAMQRFAETFYRPGSAAPQGSASGMASAIWVEMPLPVPDSMAESIPIQLEFVNGVTNWLMIQGRQYGYVDAMPSLGDVVRLFGAPSCVNPQSPGFNGWSLFYDTPSGIVIVGMLGRDSIRWTQPVYFVYARAA